MPRIGSFKFRAGMDYEAPSYNITINYSRKDKKFYADLPQEVTDATGQGRVKDKDEDALTRYIRKACTEFWESQKTMEKVIVYEFKANAVKENPESTEDQYIQPIWKSKDISFAPSPAISLMYRVCNKLTLPDGKYSFVNDRRRTVFQHPQADETRPYMKWTQEAEKFFSQFETQLTEMAYNIHLFLDKDPEQLSLNISQASGVLPFFNQEES